MANSPTERTGKVQLNLNVPTEMKVELRRIAKENKRNLNAQWETIFEEWLSSYGKGKILGPPIEDADVPEPNKLDEPSSKSHDGKPGSDAKRVRRGHK